MKPAHALTEATHRPYQLDGEVDPTRDRMIMTCT
jgi:hypothetical protein